MSIEIPNYALHRKIGAGAFAEVWLAEHKHNRRKAAIKILKGTMEPGGDEEQLFLREGEVLASFDQPNIVRIFDNAKVGDHAYLVMEYLPGGSLADRMSRQGITVGEAIGHVVQIAAALDAAHQRDIIHRDLKPANIMLRNETTPVLTDFGASRLVKRSTIHGKGGGVIGTPQYMSPEQIRGDVLDGRSDLYALGVLFHELLSGKVPFDGTVTEVVVQHLQAPAPRLPLELKVLQPILDKLLAKDRDDRFTSGAALCDALRQCFLDQDALRRLVQFAPASAWSSQLLALGFQLDTQRRNEVRIAQGQALNATAAHAAALDDGFSTRAAALPSFAQAPPPAPNTVPPPMRQAPPASMPPLAQVPAPMIPPALPSAPGSGAVPATPLAARSHALRVLAWVVMGLLVMMGISTQESDAQAIIGALVLLLLGQGAFLWLVVSQSRRHGRIVLLVASFLAQLPTAAILIVTLVLNQPSMQEHVTFYFSTLLPLTLFCGIVIANWVLIVSKTGPGVITALVLVGLGALSSEGQAWANTAAGLAVIVLWGLVGWFADLRHRNARN